MDSITRNSDGSVTIVHGEYTVTFPRGINTVMVSDGIYAHRWERHMIIYKVSAEVLNVSIASLLGV